MTRKRRESKGSPSKEAAGGADALFNSYAASKEKEDVIGPEGVERFCSDLGLSPSDRRVLLLAWKMGAKQMGYFSRPEFAAGLASLHVTSLAQLKNALPRLDATISYPAAFQEFFNFSFRFCLTEPGQKIIDTETAAEMLELVHPEGRFVPSFARFLRQQTDYRKINSDQWANFLRFSREVSPDMSNAGDNAAWPILLDNFVEFWHKEQEEMAKGREEEQAAKQAKAKVAAAEAQVAAAKDHPPPAAEPSPAKHSSRKGAKPVAEPPAKASKGKAKSGEAGAPPEAASAAGKVPAKRTKDAPPVEEAKEGGRAGLRSRRRR